MLIFCDRTKKATVSFHSFIVESHIMHARQWMNLQGNRGAQPRLTDLGCTLDQTGDIAFAQQRTILPISIKLKNTLSKS